MRSSAGNNFDTPSNIQYRKGWSAFWNDLTEKDCRHKKGSFEWRRWHDGFNDAAMSCNLKASKRHSHADLDIDTTS